MCIMAPAKVVSVDGQLCEVQTGDRIDKASMMLEPDLVVGDWVLVNAGTVVRKLDEEQAAEMTRAVAFLFADPEEPAAAAGGTEAATPTVVPGSSETGPAF
jgi:hydrogenase assembly chaperone HypC/HupF